MKLHEKRFRKTKINRDEIWKGVNEKSKQAWLRIEAFWGTWLDGDIQAEKGCGEGSIQTCGQKIVCECFGVKLLNKSV
jgi:hypothetical protein